MSAGFFFCAIPHDHETFIETYLRPAVFCPAGGSKNCVNGTSFKSPAVISFSQCAIILRSVESRSQLN